MNLEEFKSHKIKQKLKIDDQKFSKIFVFIDFANVNNWFTEDVSDWDDNVLSIDKTLSIDIEKLFDFVKCFFNHARFYYGHDPQNKNSICLFSSDADFISLIKFLKNNRKKIILIKGGYVQYSLKANSDLVVNAQDIKRYIACIKQKSGYLARSCG